MKDYIYVAAAAAASSLKQSVNDTMTTNNMSPMASLELAVIIIIPLAVLLVVLLLTMYCIYYWSCRRIRGGADHLSFCRVMCVADNWSCCRTREESDGESNNMFTDFVTPEAIIPQGRVSY